MDKETTKILSEGERIRQTLDTPGWGIMEERMESIIRDVTDIRNIPGDTAEERLREIEKREGAVSLLEVWLNMVKGDTLNAELLAPKIDDDGLVNRD